MEKNINRIDGNLLYEIELVGIDLNEAIVISIESVETIDTVLHQKYPQCSLWILTNDPKKISRIPDNVQYVMLDINDPIALEKFYQSLPVGKPIITDFDETHQSIADKATVHSVISKYTTYVVIACLSSYKTNTDAFIDSSILAAELNCHIHPLSAVIWFLNQYYYIRSMASLHTAEYATVVDYSKKYNVFYHLIIGGTQKTK